MDPKKEGVGQRVAVNTSRLDAESRPMEGWLDGAVLDLADDDLVEAVKPIRYELSVQRFDDELLVSGSVAVEMDLVCVKTAEIFSTTVSDFAFVRSFPLQQEAEDVELTEEIRESILLLVPVHPVHPSPSADPVAPEPTAILIPEFSPQLQPTPAPLPQPTIHSPASPSKPLTHRADQ